jgi:zinc transporter
MLLNTGNTHVFYAFLITLWAGLSTGIGSALVFFTKSTNRIFLSISLGFSAGVMIYVSFVELFSSAQVCMSPFYGNKLATVYATIAFFSGVALIGIIDRLIPEAENPHELPDKIAIQSIEKCDTPPNDIPRSGSLLRTGMVTAIVLAIHNFPEGMVTFMSALGDLSLALPIAIAIALHNIPEGISVAIPIYHATGRRKKAFLLSFASGLAEPIGGLIGFLLLRPFLNDTVLGCCFAAIAGIMVYISFDELLPAAEKFGHHHTALYGLVGGMAFMALSLILL